MYLQTVDRTSFSAMTRWGRVAAWRGHPDCRATQAVVLAGTAEIITKACARGYSSVIVTWIFATHPAGVSLASRAAAPPVSFMVGRPDGRLTTPMSRHHTPARIPVPSALAQASLAANRFA